MTTALPNTIETPCIGICRLTGEMCRGCGRTIAEIAGWRAMSPQERKTVMARLSAGFSQVAPVQEIR